MGQINDQERVSWKIGNCPIFPWDNSVIYKKKSINN